MAAKKKRIKAQYPKKFLSVVSSDHSERVDQTFIDIGGEGFGGEGLFFEMKENKSARYEAQRLYDDCESEVEYKEGFANDPHSSAHTRAEARAAIAVAKKKMKQIGFVTYQAVKFVKFTPVKAKPKKKAKR